MVFLVLKWNKKPPPYTLHLASKTRKIIKFCLIPHFVIGLIMFTNSSILTPEHLNLSIYNFMFANNRYLNSSRYQNVHSAIYLTALFIFLIIMILRFTLYCCFRELHQVCCTKIKKYLRPEEIQSENVYNELSMKHLLQEYDKTKSEIQGIKEDGNMKERLSRKMEEMLSEMRARIIKVEKGGLEMPVDKWTEKEVRQRFEEMAKDSAMLGKPEVRGKMISKVYSYDFADNERYLDLKKLIVAPANQLVVEKVVKKKIKLFD